MKNSRLSPILRSTLTTLISMTLLSAAAHASGSISSSEVLKDYGVINSTQTVIVNQETLQIDRDVIGCPNSPLIVNGVRLLFTGGGTTDRNACKRLDALLVAAGNAGGSLVFTRQSNLQLVGYYEDGESNQYLSCRTFLSYKAPRQQPVHFISGDASYCSDFNVTH